MNTRHLDLDTLDESSSSSSSSNSSTSRGNHNDVKVDNEKKVKYKRQDEVEFMSFEHFETNPKDREKESNYLVMPTRDYTLSGKNNELNNMRDKQLFHEMLASISNEVTQISCSCNKKNHNKQQQQQQQCCHNNNNIKKPMPLSSSLPRYNSSNNTNNLNNSFWNKGAKDGVNEYRDLNGNFISQKEFNNNNNSYNSEEQQEDNNNKKFTHLHKARYCVEAGLHQHEPSEIYNKHHHHNNNNNNSNNNSGNNNINNTTTEQHSSQCTCNTSLKQLSDRFHEIQNKLVATFDVDGNKHVDRAYMFRVLLDKLTEFNSLERQHNNVKTILLHENEIKNNKDKEIKHLEKQILLEKQTKECIINERNNERKILNDLEIRLREQAKNLKERDIILYEKENNIRQLEAKKRKDNRDNMKNINILYEKDRENWNKFRQEHIQLERELQKQINILNNNIKECKDSYNNEKIRTYNLQEENKQLYEQIKRLELQIDKIGQQNSIYNDKLSDKDKEIYKLHLQNKELEIKLKEYEYMLNNERDIYNRNKQDLQHKQLAELNNKLNQQQLPIIEEKQEKQQEKQSIILHSSSSVNSGWASGPINHNFMLFNTKIK